MFQPTFAPLRFGVEAEHYIPRIEIPFVEEQCIIGARRELASVDQLPEEYRYLGPCSPELQRVIGYSWDLLNRPERHQNVDINSLYERLEKYGKALCFDMVLKSRWSGVLARCELQIFRSWKLYIFPPK